MHIEFEQAKVCYYPKIGFPFVWVGSKAMGKFKH